VNERVSSKDIRKGVTNKEISLLGTFYYILYLDCCNGIFEEA